MSLLQTYSSLSSSSSRSTISQTLHSIAGGTPIDAASCKSLTQLLLDDLQSAIIDENPSRLSHNDALSALSAVKSLGKTPNGSGILASATNLKCLMSLATKLETTPDASNEALKCVANSLLLNEIARTRLLSEEVDGGNLCIDILQKSTTPEHIFIVSRILFLCTTSRHQSASFIQSIVETRHARFPDGGTVINLIALKLEDLIVYMEAGANMARDAMTDMLKFVFNLLVHYPKLSPSEVQSPGLANHGDDQKVMGEFWNPSLDAVLPPLVHAFQAIPLSSPNPLVSPLTHIIHSLITIPVNQSTRLIWFSTHTPSFPDTPPSASPDTTGPSCDTQPRNGTSSAIPVARNSISSSSRPLVADCATRAYDILDMTLAHFLPGIIDPDDHTVRDRCKVDSDSTLDEIVCPIVILLTRFCLGDDDAKTRIRERLVPADLDRTHLLETRPDLLGRCMRLLACVYHSSLKDAMGEMLYAMCDSNATTLASCFGYGNVAGFLFHKGIASAPTTGAASGAPPVTVSGLPINPITGIIDTDTRNTEDLEMTEEEKEREAEKLFVLFNRLSATGMLPQNQNPYRMQHGKMG